MNLYCIAHYYLIPKNKVIDHHLHLTFVLRPEMRYSQLNSFVGDPKQILGHVENDCDDDDRKEGTAVAAVAAAVAAVADVGEN